MATALDEESIFCAALQLVDAIARATYLTSACGDNPRLRERIERLLSAYDGGEYLEGPVSDLAATALLSAKGEQP